YFRCDASSVQYSSDGTQLFTGGPHYGPCIWNASTGQLRYDYLTHGANITSGQAPDGSRIFTSDASDTRLWTTEQQRSSIVLPHEAPVDHAGFSRDSAYLVTASRDRTAKLWLKSGRLLAALTGHRGWVTDAVFSPDGALIVT